MNEHNEINRILLSLPANKRLFRNNVGTGWVGLIVEKRGNSLVLRDPRPLHSGLCKGSSDLIGWTTVEITADMVGNKIAVFTAVEVKTGNVRITEEQKNFIDKVNEAGGIGEVIRIKS